MSRSTLKFVCIILGAMLFLSAAALADDCDNMSTNDLESAIVACTQAINSGKWKGHDLASKFKNRGIAYGQKNDFGRSLADLNNAIKLDPRNALSYIGRGLTYQKSGDLDRALVDYDKAISLAPKLGATYGQRGQIYRIKGDIDHAISEYSKAISLDPKFVPYVSARGDLYETKGDLDHAIADYTQAISLDPTAPNYFRLRSAAYKAKDDLILAIADLTQAISLDPKFASSFRDRGYLNLYAGFPDKALADLNQASALAPADPYNALWLEIANRRNEVPSRLERLSSQIDMTVWPAPLISEYMGQMPASAVLAAADNPNADKKKRQICEANFYNAELLLLKGVKDEATRLFRSAVDDCPVSYVEWYAAKTELKALGISTVTQSVETQTARPLPPSQECLVGNKLNFSGKILGGTNTSDGWMVQTDLAATKPCRPAMLKGTGLLPPDCEMFGSTFKATGIYSSSVGVVDNASIQCTKNF